MIGFPMLIYRMGEVTNPYIRTSWRELLDNLNNLQAHASVVRQYVVKSKDPIKAMFLVADNSDFAWDYCRGSVLRHLRGAKKAAVSLRLCESTAEIMEHTYASDLIGGAFSFYLEHGMLLADVHANNVGVVTRKNDHDDEWGGYNVITDPGHMVPLDPRWVELEIPGL